MSVFKDRYGDLRIGWYIVLLLIGALAFLFALIAITTKIDVRYQRIACENYERVTSRDTRFERPNFWQYGCYVKTGDGWYLIDQTIHNVEEN